MNRIVLFLGITLFTIGSEIRVSVCLAAEPIKVIELWGKGAPGESGSIGQEQDTTKPNGDLVAGQRVLRLGNVSKPTISVYRPAPEKDTGAAVLVCPGGGYTILAMDLEGTEVCEWLNSIGVTGVLLKYRVPRRPGQTVNSGPLQDAQRALGLVRYRAKEWGIDAKRIGALGFSAGGHLVANLSNNCDRRSYVASDDADTASCRPDFTLLIYPGGMLASKEGEQLAPEMRITTNTPATFLSMSADDAGRVENVLYYTLALRKAKVPVELHVYTTGGHGYGLRPRKGEPATTWPARAEDWLKNRGYLQRGKE